LGFHTQRTAEERAKQQNERSYFHRFVAPQKGGIHALPPPLAQAVRARSDNALTARIDRSTSGKGGGTVLIRRSGIKIKGRKNRTRPA
jgi:hypothetical protein